MSVATPLGGRTTCCPDCDWSPRPALSPQGAPRKTTANRRVRLPGDGVGEVPPLRYAVECKLCWSLEKLCFGHGPRSPTARQPLRPTRPPLPSAPARPRTRIRGATVRPSGARGNCARRPPRSPWGARPDAAHPPTPLTVFAERLSENSLRPPW